MPVLVNQIKLSPNDDEALVLEKALARVGKKQSDMESFRITRRSVDARKKQVSLIYQAELSFYNEKNIPYDSDVIWLPKEAENAPLVSHLPDRPVIVGTGPAGLFCAYVLATAGARPILLERGASVEKRAACVEEYWKDGVLSPRSNVQFGEGGAGTFSDGKLTTRIGDARVKKVLSLFHQYGADADILYKAKPHIGSDVLRRVIKNMRNDLIEKGCEFRFETTLSDIKIKNGRIESAITDTGEEIPCRHLILAIGHSARDTYEMLYQKGISMVQKPFSVGLRIEHLQADIDRARYGSFAGHPKLGAAEYQLSSKVGDHHCYSFCMCPGGLVVAAASEPESIVTNGMSNRARNEKNANSALCAGVDRRFFESDHPLAGMFFQRELEKKAYALAGSTGAAPVQTVGSFLGSGKPAGFGKVFPSYTGETCLANLQTLFPLPILETLQAGIQMFGKKIDGFSCSDAVLTGPETRTSAPVRILRNENYESTNLGGMYPAGEGAGYAGGIMSAAVDGMRVAEGILTNEKDGNNEQ